jgi:hypothetical protein
MDHEGLRSYRVPSCDYVSFVVKDPQTVPLLPPGVECSPKIRQMRSSARKDAVRWHKSGVQGVAGSPAVKSYPGGRFPFPQLLA